MTTVRCPSCAAAVPADAAWCTLCFAQMRAPASTPAPEPVAATTSEPFAMPLTAAITAPVLTAPVLSAPVPTTTAVIEPGPPSWPCSGCSEQVTFESTVCPRCGTEFMGGVNPNVSLKVPGVGDLVGMSAGAKFGVMAGGAAVLATILVLILMVLGHIF